MNEHKRANPPSDTLIAAKLNLVFIGSSIFIYVLSHSAIFELKTTIEMVAVLIATFGG